MDNEKIGDKEQKIDPYYQPKDLADMLTSKSTYISSKKFEYTIKEIFFSIIFALVFGSVVAFVAILFQINSNSNVSFTEVSTRFFLVLGISTIFIFISRIVLKRGIEIFSVFLMAVFVLSYFTLLGLTEYEGRVCRELNGQWEKIQKNPRHNIFMYECYVDGETLKKYSASQSFPLNFMEFRVKN